MKQEEFTIKDYDYLFRFAKMNAIEILALETQFTFNSMKQSQTAIETALERIEVKVGEQWVAVKMKNQQVYTPDILEEDIHLVSALMNEFTNKIIKKVFLKSEESQ